MRCQKWGKAWKKWLQSYTRQILLFGNLKAMQDMKVKVDISDSILNRLGIDGLIPDIFKKKTNK